MPWIGGNHFVFFQPIFNVADASLCVSVFVLILFYARFLATLTSDKKAVEELEQESEENESLEVENKENSQDSDE